MIDFPSPIDPFEHVKIEKINKIGKDEPQEKKEHVLKPVSKKIFLYLSLLNIFSNFLKLFHNTKKNKEIFQTPVFQELKNIKSSLDLIKENDLSQNTDFMNLFAFTWIKFLKDYEEYFKNNEDLSLIKKLKSYIFSYPKDTEFTLGYYISQFAGYKWIPFPYMEILSNLHFEHIKDPKNSHLTLWVDLIDTILSEV